MFISVVALVTAGGIALVLSGRPGTAAGQGRGDARSDARQAGVAARKLAAAWVVSQVSRTAIVACDPVMCQALRSRGIPSTGLYQLGPDTTSPLHSEVIVATAAVRAQFGNLLSAVYAPAVMASFGSGPQRIDIRVTAQHGAAAYRAMLTADLLSRKAAGAELLHSNRIGVTATARRQLSAGQVDTRLLSAIAGMVGTHPMYIVDFGSPAPGADADMPLRSADLAETGYPGRQASRSAIAAYVRSMVAFLDAQHVPYRPSRVETVRLAGRAVLRIEFAAPSPLDLLSPPKA